MQRTYIPGIVDYDDKYYWNTYTNTIVDIYIVLERTSENSDATVPHEKKYNRVVLFLLREGPALARRCDLNKLG